MEKVICGVDCRIEVDDMRDVEVIKYIDIIEHEHKQKPTTLVLSLNDKGDVVMEYTKPSEAFERIRRITGYLVGTTDRFNNAKRDEERDRVKHKF